MYAHFSPHVRVLATPALAVTFSIWNRLLKVVLEEPCNQQRRETLLKIPTVDTLSDLRLCYTQSHSDDSHVHAGGLCSAYALPQARPNVIHSSSLVYTHLNLMM